MLVSLSTLYTVALAPRLCVPLGLGQDRLVSLIYVHALHITIYIINAQRREDEAARSEKIDGMRWADREKKTIFELHEPARQPAATIFA